MFKATMSMTVLSSGGTVPNGRAEKLGGPSGLQQNATAFKDRKNTERGSGPGFGGSVYFQRKGKKN